MGIHNSDVQTQQKKHGGNKAVIYVYAMELLENMAFISLSISLITYLYGYMNFSLTKSATTVTNFLGTCFLLSLFGGFLSDTYFSRFKTVVLCGCFELSGYIILTAQAHYEQLRPIPCKGQMNQCKEATSVQQLVLFTGLYLVAIGNGGIRSALPSLGAEQFDENDPKESIQLSSFFNWFLFSLTIGNSIGVTFVVWLSTYKGWQWSFVVCTLAVFFSLVFLCSGMSSYRHNSPQGSPLTRIAQVFVATIRNRNLPIPVSTNEVFHDKEAGNHGEVIERTNDFRFLDKAAIVKTRNREPDGPWRLCTVTQVEETKIILRMVPIILSTVFLNTCLAQLQTFTIQQSTTMDTNLLGFHIPGPSIPVIPLLCMSILIPLYDRVFVPLARKLTGITTGIRHLQRIGVGLVLSAVSMAVAGAVETRRKAVAVEHNVADSGGAVPMSVFWLGFQFGIFGVADMFTFIGLLEFFYSESSRGMKSLGTSISWCSMAIGYFGSSATVEIVNRVTNGWLEDDNINRDKLNYFYWLLSGLSVVNFGFYLVCASWYKYKKVEVKGVDSEGKFENVGVN